MQTLSPESPFRKGPSAQTKRPLIALLTAGLTSTGPMKKNKFHAKDVSWCARKSSLLMQIEDSVMANWTPPSAFYMDMGTAAHEVICRGLKAAGVLRAEEMRINNLGLGIGGFADAIIEMNDRLHVTEFKTCGKLPEVPKPDHVAQVTLYSLATGLQFPKLLYVSRSVASFDGELIAKDFELSPTDEEYRAMAYNICFGYYCTEAKLIPHIPHGMTKTKCTFCPFLEFCWKDGVVKGVVEAASSPLLDEIKAKSLEHSQKILDEIPLRRAETERFVNEKIAES